MGAKTVISPGGTRRSHSSGGASLQRVTAPLAVFTVKQRRAGGAAGAGSSAGGGAGDGAAAAGDCDLALAGGGLYAGVVLTWSFTSPASFSPRSLHFFPE